MRAAKAAEERGEVSIGKFELNWNIAEFLPSEAQDTFATLTAKFLQTPFVAALEAESVERAEREKERERERERDGGALSQPMMTPTPVKRRREGAKGYSTLHVAVKNFVEEFYKDLMFTVANRVS